MKNLTILTASAIALFAAAAAQAGEVKIIANPSVGADAVSAEELKKVFLITSTSLEGSRVEPVVEKGGAAHEAFLKEYVGKTDAALETYYRSLVFTGKGSMPRTVASDAEMVSFVAKTKGAIGYVSAGTAAAGVKTLEVK